MKCVVAMMQHETNTFSPLPTVLASFASGVGLAEPPSGQQAIDIYGSADFAFAGNIRYQLKTPYRDGTTHVIFEPLDFMARLAALVPRPRANLTRFHGVFAGTQRA